MKKLFTALLAMAMVLSLTACGGKKGTDAPNSSSSGANSSSSVSGSADEKENGDGSTSSAIGADSSAQEQPDASEKEESKDETPASKPAEEPAAKPEKPADKPVSKPAVKPAEDTKQPVQQPASSEKTETELPAASSGDPLSILNTVWGTYSEDEKFPAAGGDYEHAVDGAPGSFDVSDGDSLAYQLTFPAGDAGLIDSAAALTHMMNSNTFTCGAFHVASKDNVSQLAQDLRSEFQGKHWMCGFPDKLVVASMGQYVVSVYGNEELVNTFRDKLKGSYPSVTVLYDENLDA
ncbi:MAG: hypothetical protein MR327_04710 [Clostridiales bacterium]|nr:hypothetical protein [Clostridiales bacterium]